MWKCVTPCHRAYMGTLPVLAAFLNVAALCSMLPDFVESTNWDKDCRMWLDCNRACAKSNAMNSETILRSCGRIHEHAQVLLAETYEERWSRSVCCVYLWGANSLGRVKETPTTLSLPLSMSFHELPKAHHLFRMVYGVLPSLPAKVGLRCNNPCSSSCHNSHLTWRVPQRPSLTTRPVHLNTGTEPAPSPDLLGVHPKLRNICRR
jgi:hypothetical protein